MVNWGSWGIGGIVAQALRDGAFPHLEELDLSKCPITVDEMTALTQALEDRPVAYSQSLRRLLLGECSLNNAHIRVLAHAFGRGACPHLEELDLFLTTSYDAGPGVVHLANAMGSGALPHLKKLDLTHSDLSRDDITALTEALCHNNACPRLEWLSLAHTGVTCWYADDACKQAVTGLFEGLRASRGQGRLGVKYGDRYPHAVVWC